MARFHLEEEFERFRDAGDLRALARVFDEAAPQLLSVARHLAPTRSDAEDLLQASFVVAIERAATWDRTRALLPWLLGIVAMEARRARARAQREPDPARLELRESVQPFQELVGREVRVAVEAALARLPRDYAEIVRRHLIEGTAPAQLAVQLGLTQGNARTRLHRGLRMMRERMPDGFAGIGVWIWCHWTGPHAVRRPVLARAAKITGGSVPVAFGSLAVLALALLTPLALAVPFLLRDADPRAEDVATIAAFDRAPATPVETSLATERSLPAVLPLTRLLPMKPVDRVFGRLLLHDGTPAIGGVVQVHRLGTSSEPQESKSVATDSDGAFEVELTTELGESIRVQTSVPEHAVGRWWFRSLERGSRFDLGDVRLERAHSVRVRVVTPNGEPLTDGWTVAASIAPLRPDVGIEGYFLRAIPDALTGIGWIDGVPLRSVKLGATHQSGELLHFTPYDVESRAEVIELVYSGADLSRRVSVRFQPPRGVPWMPALESLRLECAAGLKHEPIRPSARLSSVEFEDVDRAPHTLHVADLRYERVERRALQPGGASVPIELIGNARVRVTLATPDAKTLARAWTLRFDGELEGTAGRSSVWSEGAEFPRDGLEVACPPGDWRFSLNFEGMLPRRLEVRDLRPEERRTLVIELEEGAARHELAGRVISSEEFRPERPLVTLTRGPRAGHGLGIESRVVDRQGSVPALDASVRADADGEFSFAGLEPGTWTVETRWSPWLAAARTVQLPLAEPVELAIPPHGTVTGRVLAPAGRKFENARLIVGEVTVEPHSEHAGGWEGRPALDADGRFALTALPVGRVELQLGISAGSMDGSSVAVHSWPLGVFEIARGMNPPLELDARAIFPADVLVDVRIDGAAATHGCVRVRSCDRDGAPTECIARVMLLGQARATTLAVGGLLECEYTDPAGWRAIASGFDPLRPGEQRSAQMEVETFEREVLVLDRDTRAPLGNVTVVWLTGSILGAEVGEQGERGECRSTTDDRGVARIRLPLGVVRAIALGGSWLESERFEWRAERTTLELEFSKLP